MKHLILPVNLTKRNNLILLGLMALALSVTSCSKEDDSTDGTESSITEEEAAEAIAMSVSPESGGMIEQTNQAIYTFEDDNSASSKAEDYECGVEYGSSYNISGQSANVTYSASLAWNWIVDCGTGIIPSAADFDLTGTSSYDGPRISSDASTTATINIQNLEDEQSSYIVNETFSIAGSQESYIRNENAFTSTIDLSTTDLTVLKSNYNIASGTISVSFHGVASNGNSYDYSGTLVFTGNQTATLTMGSGNTYELAW